MALYVTLWKYTRDGLVDVKKTQKHFEMAKKVIKASGGKLISIYGLMGHYDLLTVMEMPNEKVAATTILKVCSTGRITSETMSAMTMEDFLAAMKKV
jgi:uncharacterized protein with GYD domain